jgi:hypothetical protein
MLGSTYGSLGEIAAAQSKRERAQLYYEEALCRLRSFPEDAFAKTRLEEIRELQAQLNES